MRKVMSLERNESANLHMLRLHDWLHSLPVGAKGLADNGFWGECFPSHLDIVTPYRAPRGEFHVSAEDANRSRATSTRWRGVVERAHARMKRFKVCQYITPGSVNLENIGNKWRVAAILSNLYFVPLMK